MSNTEIMKRFDFDLQIKYSGDSVIFYAPYRITRRIMRIVQLWGYSYTSIYSHDYENIEYIVGDFTQMELNTKYDVVLSSLALHHIPNDEEKEAMYKDIYETLEKDGVFYNADVIKANSNYNEELNNKVAIQEMKENGVTDEEIAEHKGKRDANDIPTTLIKHIKMLENVGFKEIDVIWKHYSNAVYGGSKK